MNAKEHAEKLAAARAELARLEAIVPEREMPGMVLPGRSESGNYQWYVGDDLVFLYESEQREHYEDAFYTMLLMRAQKGIMNPIDQDHWFLSVDCCSVTTHGDCAGDNDLNCCMFPCFATEADARAAIAAVGEYRIIRCAKWLAGCV